jgi:alpha-N-arabinofuranosidase
MDDAWRYWSSDGMGLLDFPEWCGDLNMEPPLAVYAGYSLRQVRVKPGHDLEPYVKDALDEIEYVTGDAGTTRGARRAKDGHPAPFRLGYVEVGNEDQFDREAGSYEKAVLLNSSMRSGRGTPSSRSSPPPTSRRAFRI